MGATSKGLEKTFIADGALFDFNVLYALPLPGPTEAVATLAKTSINLATRGRCLDGPLHLIG